MDRLFTTKFFVLNQECIVSILHKSALSKFLSVKRDVNFSSRKPVGSTFLIFGTRYDEFGRKGKQTTELSFINGKQRVLRFVYHNYLISAKSRINRTRKFYMMCASERFCRNFYIFESPQRVAYSQVRSKVSIFCPPKH